MNIPRPGVTRTVKEMEAKGYLQKIASPDDGRVTFLTATEKGRKLHQKYDEEYSAVCCRILTAFPMRRPKR